MSPCICVRRAPWVTKVEKLRVPRRFGAGVAPASNAIACSSLPLRDSESPCVLWGERSAGPQRTRLKTLWQEGA